MTEGRRVDPAELAIELPPDPRCRGLCKGERGAMDSPAKFGHLSDGTKVIFCTCCGLRLPSIEEAYHGKADLGRPVNLIPSVTPTKQMRYMDDVCGYEVLRLKEIVSS